MLSEGDSVAILKTNFFSPRGRHSAGSRMGISRFPLPFSFQGTPWAASLHRAREGRGHQWCCRRAPSPLAGGRWAGIAVRFCAGERTAEGLPWPLVKKKEGEQGTKTFPLPSRFCLAEKATFIGACSMSPREGLLLGRRGKGCQTTKVIYYLHGSAGSRPTQAWKASTGSKAQNSSISCLLLLSIWKRLQWLLTGYLWLVLYSSRTLTIQDWTLNGRWAQAHECWGYLYLGKK